MVDILVKYIGKNTIIEDGAEIGDNVKIGHNCTILKDVKIGDNVNIGHNTVLGQQPLKSPISTRKTKNQPPLIIEDNCVIGSLVCISAGNTIKRGVMIGDHVSIREGNIIGEYTIIGKGVTIEYDTNIGSYTKIMNSSHITGNAIIGNHVFIGPMVTTMNDKYMDVVKNIELKGPIIHDYSLIGSNSTLLPGVEIGEYAVIGAGAVVTSNIPAHALAIGVPAKIVRQVEKGYPLKTSVK